MTDDNSKTKFLINFKSLHIVDSPNIMDKEVFLKFVRNKNELNTKPNTVSKNTGVADFNENTKSHTQNGYKKAFFKEITYTQIIPYYVKVGTYAENSKNNDHPSDNPANFCKNHPQPPKNDLRTSGSFSNSRPVPVNALRP